MTNIGKYFFRDRIKTTTDLLEIIERRFDLKSSRDPHQIYFWILDVERLAKRIGMELFPRRGRKTLIGLLNKARMWLRSKVYSSSILTLKDLLDSNNQLKPQKIDGVNFDFEKLINDIANETKRLQKLFQKYSKKETQLIKKLRQEFCKKK